MNKKIWLSPPHMSGSEQAFIDEAFKSNWITSVGSNVDGFECDIQKFIDSSTKEVTVLNSGTSAIHLALKLAGVSKDDIVLCQSLTFVAAANPVLYLGAKPVFVDSEEDTWNLDPKLLEKAIKDLITKNKKPKAIVAVHLYGMPYKVDEVNKIAEKYNIPVVEDAAEALGSMYKSKFCGTLSEFGVFSFNGNKIITTSGGGAIITSNKTAKEKALFYATQSKDSASYYQHSEIGYNYRMSNVIAGLGRAQMTVLKSRIKSRRSNFEVYKKAFLGEDTIQFLQEVENTFSNRWLTCVLFGSFELREFVRKHLESNDVESRVLWKPMHLQPLFKNELHYTNGVSEKLFQRGLCLPSGSNLKDEELNYIITTIKQALNDFR